MGHAAASQPPSSGDGIPPHVDRRLREVAHAQAGIVLGPDKTTLLATRVSKRMRQLGIDDYRAYLEHFERDPEEVQHFLNAITTNTTSFWREAAHFVHLDQYFKDRIAAGQRRFRVWCAASSTGQEPYTIALVLAAHTRNFSLDLKILATDIDTNVLSVARAATYERSVIQQVPGDVRQWGFERLPEGDYRVAEWVRRLVSFAQLNLARPPFPMKGPIDVIFCRNVMIYLDAPTRNGLAAEFERLITPGGLVMVGHSETLSGHAHRLRPKVPSVYRMPESGR